MNIKHGEFTSDWKEFVINTPNTPRHWHNFFWNKNFLSTFSQTAQGKALKQDNKGFRTNLLSSRMVYILDIDTGEFWTANAMPVDSKYEKYSCVHGMGYSEIKLSYSGIESSYKVFVPNDDACEIWTVKLKNLSKKNRNLKIIVYYNTAIQDHDPLALHAAYDEEICALVGSNVTRYGSFFNHATTGRTQDCFLTIDKKVSGFDLRKRAFIGHYDSEVAPLALKNGGCSNSIGEFEPIVFALQTTISFKENEETTLNAIVGAHDSKDEILAMRNKYFSSNVIENEFKAIKERFVEEIDTIVIDTPDQDVNNFFNTWLKHQLNFNSVWARIYFNGYRDLCQDSENLASINVERAFERFKKVLSYQFKSGYAPRAWCEGQIIDQDYADSPVWITFTTYSILMEMGDVGILETKIPFYDGEEATIYEHMKRAIEYLWNDRGLHGLSKIHCGDWNDVMNAVGKEGKGESIWLSMALFRALKQFSEIAEMKCEKEDYFLSEQRAKELAEKIQMHGWDGEYYIRAYTDEGLAVGSKDSESGKMFLNTQSWAVISNVDRGERGIAGMSAVDKYLETDIGIATLSGLFTKFRKDIGFISVIRPGENLNGGIYLHANMFKVVADCILKRNAKAYKTIMDVLPFGESRNVISGEPYVMPNSYYGPGSGEKYGEAGDAWITGTSGWLVYAIVNYVFGLKPEMEGLRIDPCLPDKWRTCSIRRPFREAVYNITFVQISEGTCNSIESIEVDDRKISTFILPYEAGKTYNVKVILSK